MGVTYGTLTRCQAWQLVDSARRELEISYLHFVESNYDPRVAAILANRSWHDLQDQLERSRQIQWEAKQKDRGIRDRFVPSVAPSTEYRAMGFEWEIKVIADEPERFLSSRSTFVRK